MVWPTRIRMGLGTYSASGCPLLVTITVTWIRVPTGMVGAEAGAPADEPPHPASSTNEEMARQKTTTNRRVIDFSSQWESGSHYLNDGIRTWGIVFRR